MKAKDKTTAANVAVVCKSVVEVADIVGSLRLQGKKIVLANGTFDLLHVGHIRLLRDAKSRGDYLVVAVNSDASVKKYKNPKLPVQKEDDRIEIISALRGVDYVFKFNEPTADSIIAAIKPDIVAKGTDYTPESVPEKETVAEYGGAIAICGDKKDHASSKLIDRIKKMK